MDLSEYIEKSLVAISLGVKNAQENAHATIAPAAIEGKPIWQPQMVKFEIEVTTSSDGRGSIKVLSIADINLGGNRGSSHRISFEVPVHFNTNNAHPKGPGRRA